MTLKELYLTLRDQDPELPMYHAKGKFPYELEDNRVGMTFCFPTTATVGEVITGIKKVLDADTRDMHVCIVRKTKV